jgi:peptide/nickel transport system permease protein
MLRYLVHRVLYLTAILALLTILIFGITQALPGNAARMILQNYSSEETLKALEKRLGLDAPVYLQYWRWVKRFVRGDMGESLISEQPVTSFVFPALGKTVVLAVATIALVALLGVSLGIVAAVKEKGPLDHVTALVAYAGISLPEFVWGIVFVLIFAGYFQVLPASGVGDPRAPLADRVAHLVMPVATLTLALIAHVLRQTRSNMLEVLRANYIKAARSRGLTERRIILRHALQNAMLPTITILALNVRFLVGSVVVVETVFAYPGFGRLMTFAIQNRDLPVIQGCALTVAVVCCLMNLLADMTYAYLNPRIRYGYASAA